MSEQKRDLPSESSVPSLTTHVASTPLSSNPLFSQTLTSTRTSGLLDPMTSSSTLSSPFSSAPYLSGTKITSSSTVPFILPLADPSPLSSLQSTPEPLSSNRKGQLRFHKSPRKLDILLAKLEKLPVADLEILIVEDSNVNSKQLKRMLIDLGFNESNISFAENGRESLRMCQGKKFNIIFMDVQMPIMSGDKAVEELRKEEGINQNTLVVCHSSNVTTTGEANELQMDYFINKTYDPENIRRVLIECLADSKLRAHGKIDAKLDLGG